MKNKKRKKTFLYIFYGLITVAFLFFILSMNDIGEIFKVLGSADVTNVLVAISLVLIYLALYPVTLCLLARAQKIGVKARDVYAIGMTEHFFNGITPFSTGGQPFQVYAFSQKKVKLATSTGLLIMNFILFMIVTNAYAIVSLFFFDRFAQSAEMRIIAPIGFTMNFLVLFFMIALATSKRIKNGIIWILTKLSKIKFLTKLLQSKIGQINEYIEQTQAAFKELWKCKGTSLLCLAVRAATMAFYYAVTFFILRALHVNVGFDQIFYIISGSAFAITMVVFLPTPGSSGGIEYAFTKIFAVFVTGTLDAVSYGGMLLWRLMTYYLPMFISLAFYVAFEISTRISERRSQAKAAAEGIGEALIRGESAEAEAKAQIVEEIPETKTIDETPREGES